MTPLRAVCMCIRNNITCYGQSFDWRFQSRNTYSDAVPRHRLVERFLSLYVCTYTYARNGLTYVMYICTVDTPHYGEREFITYMILYRKLATVSRTLGESTRISSSPSTEVVRSAYSTIYLSLGKYKFEKENNHQHTMFKLLNRGYLFTRNCNIYIYI